MNALVCCECSDVVTCQLRLAGVNAFSVDLKASEHNSPWHYQADAIDVLESYPWDLVIAHPECTFMTNAGARWLYLDGWKENGRDEQRWTDMRDATAFFLRFVNWHKRNPTKRLAIENPVMHGHAKALIGMRQTQTIQPWMHGHLEVKATCLWLFNLPKLAETDNVKEATMALPYAKRAKVHNAPPSADRSADRSRTLTGIARAYATQWTLK